MLSLSHHLRSLFRVLALPTHYLNRCLLYAKISAGPLSRQPQAPRTREIANSVRFRCLPIAHCHPYALLGRKEVGEYTHLIDLSAILLPYGIGLRNNVRRAYIRCSPPVPPYSHNIYYI